jgi:hypothetical protein
MLVEALVREYLELKVEKVVRVRELCLAGLGQLQLIQILVKVKYTPSAQPNRRGTGTKLGLGFGSALDPDLTGGLKKYIDFFFIKRFKVFHIYRMF